MRLEIIIAREEGNSVKMEIILFILGAAFGFLTASLFRAGGDE